MPEPKRKISRSRKRKRSANKGLDKNSIAYVSACQTCRAPLGSHQACDACGYYKGVKVLRTKSERMYERGKARSARQPEPMPQGPVDATAEPSAS